MILILYVYYKTETQDSAASRSGPLRRLSVKLRFCVGGLGTGPRPLALNVALPKPSLLHAPSYDPLTDLLPPPSWASWAQTPLFIESKSKTHHRYSMNCPYTCARANIYNDRQFRHWGHPPWKRLGLRLLDRCQCMPYMHTAGCVHQAQWRRSETAPSSSKGFLQPCFCWLVRCLLLKHTAPSTWMELHWRESLRWLRNAVKCSPLLDTDSFGWRGLGAKEDGWKPATFKIK